MLVRRYRRQFERVNQTPGVQRGFGASLLQQLGLCLEFLLKLLRARFVRVGGLSHEGDGNTRLKGVDTLLNECFGRSYDLAANRDQGL